MKSEAINWDEIPDSISKDQLYRICHISKSTALYLLKSGKIPCHDTGKKTHRYTIRKADVVEYLENRAIFPESYPAPAGWYGGHYQIKMEREIPPATLKQMKEFYADSLKIYKDVLSGAEVIAFTGYSKSCVNHWCSTGVVKAFKRGRVFYIPKVYLIDFLCSYYFRTITRKSPAHIQLLKDFVHWQACHGAK